MAKIASDSCGFQGKAHTAAKQLIEGFKYTFYTFIKILQNIEYIISLVAYYMGNKTDSYNSKNTTSHNST